MSLHDPRASDDPREAPGRDGPSGGRLPPPAFPPGRRHVPPGSGGDGLEGAFISPDAPLPGRMPPHPGHESAGTLEESMPEQPISGMGLDADEDVIVTGIGSDAHLDPGELALAGDPNLRELVDTVTKLAAALQHQGEAGLRTTPAMSRLEVQLRAYCVGYLAGRRAEDDAG